MNISMKMSFKVNPSESRKINNMNMIGSVSECEYWYELKHESEWVCEYEFDYDFECRLQANLWLYNITNVIWTGHFP